MSNSFSHSKVGSQIAFDLTFLDHCRNFFFLGGFGFLAYEQDEGKKLFFHMSEVEGGEVLQVSLGICFRNGYLNEEATKEDFW